MRSLAIEPSSRAKRTPLPADFDRPTRRESASLPGDLPGLTDLYAAVSLVASGAATVVTLCGFEAGSDHLRAARTLAIDGVGIEPVIRPGGGGFDLRVRRLSSSAS
jgi:hypothetical protein